MYKKSWFINLGYKFWLQILIINPGSSMSQNQNNNNLNNQLNHQNQMIAKIYGKSNKFVTQHPYHFHGQTHLNDQYKKPKIHHMKEIIRQKTNQQKYRNMDTNLLSKEGVAAHSVQPSSSTPGSTDNQSQNLHKIKIDNQRLKNIQAASQRDSQNQSKNIKGNQLQSSNTSNHHQSFSIQQISNQQDEVYSNENGIGMEKSKNQKESKPVSVRRKIINLTGKPNQRGSSRPESTGKNTKENSVDQYQSQEPHSKSKGALGMCGMQRKSSQNRSFDMRDSKNGSKQGFNDNYENIEGIQGINLSGFKANPKQVQAEQDHNYYYRCKTENQSSSLATDKNLTTPKNLSGHAISADRPSPTPTQKNKINRVSKSNTKLNNTCNQSTHSKNFDLNQDFAQYPGQNINNSVIVEPHEIYDSTNNVKFSRDTNQDDMYGINAGGSSQNEGVQSNMNQNENCKTQTKDGQSAPSSINYLNEVRDGSQKFYKRKIKNKQNMLIRNQGQAQYDDKELNSKKGSKQDENQKKAGPNGEYVNKINEMDKTSQKQGGAKQANFTQKKEDNLSKKGVKQGHMQKMVGGHGQPSGGSVAAGVKGQGPYYNEEQHRYLTLSEYMCEFQTSNHHTTMQKTDINKNQFVGQQKGSNEMGIVKVNENGQNNEIMTNSFGEGVEATSNRGGDQMIPKEIDTLGKYFYSNKPQNVIHDPNATDVPIPNQHPQNQQFEEMRRLHTSHGPRMHKMKGAVVNQEKKNQEETQKTSQDNKQAPNANTSNYSNAMPVPNQDGCSSVKLTTDSFHASKRNQSINQQVQFNLALGGKQESEGGKNGGGQGLQMKYQGSSSNYERPPDTAPSSQMQKILQNQKNQDNMMINTTISSHKNQKFAKIKNKLSTQMQGNDWKLVRKISEKSNQFEHMGQLNNSSQMGEENQMMMQLRNQQQNSEQILIPKDKKRSKADSNETSQPHHLQHPQLSRTIDNNTTQGGSQAPPPSSKANSQTSSKPINVVAWQGGAAGNEEFQQNPVGIPIMSNVPLGPGPATAATLGYQYEQWQRPPSRQKQPNQALGLDDFFRPEIRQPEGARPKTRGGGNQFINNTNPGYTIFYGAAQEHQHGQYLGQLQPQGRQRKLHMQQFIPSNNILQFSNVVQLNNSDFLGQTGSNVPIRNGDINRPRMIDFFHQRKNNNVTTFNSTAEQIQNFQKQYQMNAYENEQCYINHPTQVQFTNPTQNPNPRRDRGSTSGVGGGVQKGQQISSGQGIIEGGSMNAHVGERPPSRHKDPPQNLGLEMYPISMGGAPPNGPPIEPMITHPNISGIASPNEFGFAPNSHNHHGSYGISMGGVIGFDDDSDSNDNLDIDVENTGLFWGQQKQFKEDDEDFFEKQYKQGAKKDKESDDNKLEKDKEKKSQPEKEGVPRAAKFVRHKSDVMNAPQPHNMSQNMGYHPRDASYVSAQGYGGHGSLNNIANMNNFNQQNQTVNVTASTCRR